MKVLQFLIDTSGTLIWPLTLPNASPSSFNYTGLNTAVFTFFNDIIETRNQFSGELTDVTPTDPVTVGLTGSINVQARPTPNSPWLNIEDTPLDISINDVMLNIEGLITALQVTPTSVTGCNYIFCELTRGA